MLASYRQSIGALMTPPQIDLLQGTLDVLILKAIALQELHGMGISRRISQVTNGAFEVRAGSLFPALHRMEEAGWLTSTWGESETNRRAKFYSLTKAGKKQLLSETQRWERISLAMAAALGTS
jgi:PadR family transcriptional regulator, regulatory protein PadR